ncbi:insulin-like growth factor-binding protein 1b [Gadus morhua]|uniref:insulin-like growth factor-binding protein 1b n=1 Tax=Gadus morhua TaxID=8049 RepID=UPI0011B773EF|nr:insulin-like growth factor-binding protein 1 [Gadus morhua]
MSGIHRRLTVVVVTVVVVSVGVLGGLASCSPVAGPIEPIRCSACTPEKLSQCPAVAPDCGQMLREPGCGCCMACALETGSSCGVHTAHCGLGLRCTAGPGEARPLHALIRGQGVCTQEPGTEDVGGLPDHSSLHYLLGFNGPLEPRDAAEAQETIKAKVNSILKKLVQQGPCHIELHAALDGIASSQQALGDKFTTFYLPNCDKYGYYKAKQCESSLNDPPARCWCVSSWNGKRIPGSNDLPTDSQCNQELTH